MDDNFVESCRLSDEQINAMLVNASINAVLTPNQMLYGVTVNPETNATVEECAVELAASIRRLNNGELKPLDYPL